MLPAPPFALFDDNQDAAGDLLLSGLRETLVCDRAEDLSATFAAIASAQAAGCWVALAAAYELGYLLEPRLAPLLPAHRPTPLFTAWVFTRGQRRSAEATAEDIAATLASIDARQRAAGLMDLAPTLDAGRYRAAVARIRALIHAGDCYQVNYTFPLTGRAYGAPLALYERLRRAQPVRYGAFISDGRRHMLSRSPELFIERRGHRLVCRPMKGTAPRTSDPQALADSAKNRAENVMIVDLLRNDLGRVCAFGSVAVDKLFETQSFTNVHHLVSSISGRLEKPADVYRLLEASFPGGSITGTPKIRAMEIISELETRPRSVYCGAIGWISRDGNMDSNIAIRTLVRQGDQIHCWGGGGLVADSVGTEEYQETLDKIAIFIGNL